MPDRVWVVTGANSGLGLAISLHALSKGDKVIATVRSLSECPQELKEAGAEPLVMDLSESDKDLCKAALTALNIYGHVDVLVNNAAQINSGAGPVEETSMEGVRELFQSNLFGTLAFTQPFIAHFRERRAGTIINISSGASVLPMGALGSYSATKAALDAYTAALQSELTPYGVRALTILTGYFATSAISKSPQYSPEPFSAAYKPPSTLSKVYTDPRTQGYDWVNNMWHSHLADGQIGDPAKFAARVFDVVTRSGYAEGLDIGEGERRNWNKVPLGADCECLIKPLETIVESIKALEPIWRSTDVEPERLKLYGKG